MASPERLCEGVMREASCRQPIHGSGSPLGGLLQTARKMADSDATILLTGETGTGKEVFARFVHENSPRRNKRFVPVNCGAIPEALLESELFGHARGAFTGANQSRKGRVALADGGTLFLDEVSELPLPLQVKLLRLLQEHTYEAVGNPESIHVDFRLVAATNRDLLQEIEEGNFRKDLYYRLFVCPIEIPSLVDRAMDIVPLFKTFWARFGESRPIDGEVLACLESYSWPGNVREVENLAQRISVCATGDRITKEDLPPPYCSMRTQGHSALYDESISEDRMILFSGSSSVHCSAAENHSDPASEVSVLPDRSFSDVPIPSASEPHQITESEASSIEPHPSRNSNAAFETLDRGEQEFERFCKKCFTEDVSLPLDLAGYLRRIEDELIDLALEFTKGNKKAAADLLMLRRTTLVEKLKRRQKSDSNGRGP